MNKDSVLFTLIYFFLSISPSLVGAVDKAAYLALDEKSRAQAGNLLIDAQSATIEHTLNQSDSQSRFSYKQSGLSVNLGGAIIGAAQNALQNVERAQASEDGRVRAMATASAAYQAYQAGSALQAAASGGNALRLSITLGSQKTEQKQSSHQEQVQASQASADGASIIRLSGKGKDSRLHITGSDVGGAALTQVQAEGAVLVKAAAANSHRQPQRKS